MCSADFDCGHVLTLDNVTTPQAIHDARHHFQCQAQFTRCHQHRTSYALAMAKGSTGSQRQYRFVYWHHIAKVWVWHRKGCAAHGQHANQHKAAKMAAAAWKLPVSKLRLSPAQPRRPPVRLHRHVHYHSKSKTWVVQLSGHSVGSSTCQHAAARIASKALKVPLSKLRLPKATHSRPMLLTHKLRFQLMWAIYREKASAGKTVKARMPGDLEHLFHSSQAAHMMHRYPELLMPYILAKYGPHREALAASAAQLAGQRSQMQPSEWLHSVLRSTLLRLSGTVLSEAWVLIVGCGTAFHSGLVPSPFAVCAC